jgi:hypothetical protein
MFASSALGLSAAVPLVSFTDETDLEAVGDASVGSRGVTPKGKPRNSIVFVNG